MLRALFCLLIVCLPVTFLGCKESGNRVIDVNEIPPEWQDDPATNDLSVE